jgi:hypothetical protein
MVFWSHAGRALALAEQFVRVIYYVSIPLIILDKL